MGTIVDVHVAALLLPWLSVVDVATFAVLLNGPGGAFEATASTSVNVAWAPDASDAMVQLKPAPGGTHVNTGPVPWTNETNAVLAGNVSVSTTWLAAEGPVFPTVIEYVMLVPAVTLAGPVFNTDTSAIAPMVVVTLDALSRVSVSN